MCIILDLGISAESIAGNASIPVFSASKNYYTIQHANMCEISIISKADFMHAQFYFFTSAAK